MSTAIVAVSICALSLSACHRSDSLRSERERVLKQDLAAIRASIDQYTLDKQKAPQSLVELVSSGYMKALPEEPTTHRIDCWIPVLEDIKTAVDKNQPGIVDVHSCNDQRSSEGTPYSVW